MAINKESSIISLLGLFVQHGAAIAEAGLLVCLLLLDYASGVVINATLDVLILLVLLQQRGFPEAFGSFIGGGVGEEVFKLVSQQRNQHGAEEGGQQSADDHVSQLVLAAIGVSQRQQSRGLQSLQCVAVIGDADKEHLHTPHQQKEEEGGELAYVECAHAVVDPGTVVVVPAHAHSADEAVELSGAQGSAALRTTRQLHIHKVLPWLLGVLACEQCEEYNHRQVVGGDQAIEHQVGVIAEDINLHQQVRGKQHKVEEKEEEHALPHRRLLHAVHHLEVTPDLYLIAVAEVLLQHTRNIATALLPRQVNGPLVLEVDQLAIHPLQQHTLHHFLVPATDCVHQRRPSLQVARIHVHPIDQQQVGRQGGEAVFGGLVQDGVAQVIGVVGIVGRPSLAVFEQVDCSLELVVLDGHEERRLLVLGLCQHVGSVVFEEVEHVGVAVKGCEVQRSESVGIGVVEPGAQLSFQSAAQLAALVVGLEVLHVDAQFRQLILEGSEVNQGRLVLLPHDGEVEIGPLLQVAAQVVVRLDAHDHCDRLALARRHLLPAAHGDRLIMRKIDSLLWLQL